VAGGGGAAGSGGTGGGCGAVGQSCCAGAQCSIGLVCAAGKCELPASGWVKLAGSGLPAARVRALAIDQSGHIFAALYGVGVYVSTDEGATFTKVGKPATLNDPAVLTILTLALNGKGEPVIGVAPPGSGTTSTIVFRLDSTSNTWATATVTQDMNLGGYFPPAIRLDVDGSLLSSWPFRNDIMRSTDGGSSWTNQFPIPNASHVPPSGPSPLVKAVYGVGSQRESGELFCGTEGDQWWHSTDRGTTWSMVDEGGTSSLALEPGQNGFLVAFNKDGEPLFGTQGKPDGNFLLRLTSDGKVVASNGGFAPWAMVGTATEGTVLREIALTQEGHQFLAMPVNDNQGGALPADVYGSDDGSTWKKLSAPFVPELNAVAALGPSVLVGGGPANPGVIWKYTPPMTSRLPRVKSGLAPGQIATSGLSGLTLNGSATDPDGDPLTFSWKARGPGVVTFGSSSAAVTTAKFSAPGDYVLTLHASDGTRSAGAPVIVHVSGS
jgi:hypothetical protein